MTAPSCLAGAVAHDVYAQCFVRRMENPAHLPWLGEPRVKPKLLKIRCAVDPHGAKAQKQKARGTFRCVRAWSITLCGGSLAHTPPEPGLSIGAIKAVNCHDGFGDVCGPCFQQSLGGWDMLSCRERKGLPRYAQAWRSGFAGFD